MKKSLKRVLAILFTIILVAGIFYGCNRNNAPVVTDSDGVSYLYVENDGKKYACIEMGDSGARIAYPIDDNGNIITDGEIIVFDPDLQQSQLIDTATGEVISNDVTFPAETYEGKWPENDTTAVSIEQTTSGDSYDYGSADVVTDNNATTVEITPTEESTTKKQKPNSNNSTTKKDNSGTSSTTKKQNNSTTKPNSGTKTYLSDKYKQLFESGTYYIQFSINEEGMTEPVTAAFKNGNIYMETTMDDMDCQMIYQADKEALYAVIPSYHIYCKMAPDMVDELDISSFSGSDTGVEKITVSNVTLGGRPCVSETYKYSDGSTYVYYFYNEELVRMDEIEADGTSTVMTINAISSNVDDSLFKLPKGYVPINLSKIDLLGSEEETTKAK